MFKITSAIKTDQGLKRSRNEDAVAQVEPSKMEVLHDSGSLYIVSDGMGSTALSGRSGEYVTEKVTFEYYKHTELPTIERLRQAMRQAGNDLYTYTQENNQQLPSVAAAAVVIRGPMLTVANVGSCRVYLVRNGKAQQLTQDQAWVGQVDRGDSLGEVRTASAQARSRLFPGLGSEPDAHINAVSDLPLRSGDRVVLCTDGFSQYASLSDVAELASDRTPEEAASEMVKFAKQRGGADNISLVVVEISPAAGEAVETTAQPRVVARTAESSQRWDVLAADAARRTFQKVDRRVLLPASLGGAILLILVVALAARAALRRPASVATPTPEIQVAANLPPTLTLGVSATSVWATPSPKKTQPMVFGLFASQTAEHTTPSPTPPPIINSGPYSGAVCIIRFGADAYGVDEYLMKFNSKYSPYSVEIHYVSGEPLFRCELNSNGDACDDVVPLKIVNDNPIVQVDDWLVVPYVTEDECTMVKGAAWVTSPILPTPMPTTPTSKPSSKP